MSTATRDRAIKLLAEDIPQHLVASALGVTDSYISQLLDEPAVMEELAVAKAAKLEAVVEQNDTLDEIRKAALTRIKSTLPFAKSPLEAARVFQIVDNARKGPETGANGVGTDTVVITLPKAARASVQITLNEHNQVIDVGGRSMAPLPSKALPALAASRKAQAQLPMDVPAKVPTVAPAKADKVVAAEKMQTLPDITTIMDGVPLVL